MFHIVILFCFYVVLGHTLPLENTGPSDVRIINGENATLGQFPWQVGLYLGFDDTVWFCGGSIISENWILTAAHCLDRSEIAYVYVGTVDLLLVPEMMISTDLILHEEYNASTLANDIGVIKLSIGLGFNDIIAPITLSSEPIEDGAEVTVSGFGLTSDADDAETSQFLNYVTVTTIPNSECAEIYGDSILENMVCTSAGSDPVKGACLGDSGSPAVLNVDTDPLQVAIASFIGGTGCEEGNPSGFTRIAPYRDWIQEKTGV